MRTIPDMNRGRYWAGVLTLALLGGCSKPVEMNRVPFVRMSSTTVERLTADSLFLSITVSEEQGRLKRTATLTNRSSRLHTVSWVPGCGDLIWLLLDPANPTGVPRYNAARVQGEVCSLVIYSHTLTAGETYAAPEWQAVTSALKFVGDSLPTGTYLLGISVQISDLAARLQVGPVEFVWP